MTKKNTLTAKQQRFVQEYLIDLNATQAAIRASYSRRVAGQIGDENLKKPQIAFEIQKAKDERAQKVGIEADMVLSHLWAIATADPNEIVSYRLGACRFCHGIEHAYQWTGEAEFKKAEAKARGSNYDAISIEGGFGFDLTADPHPDCPACCGEGIGRMHVAETRTLSPQARKLLAGVKYTRYGVEVRLHDQLAALEKVARHLGMFNDKLTLKGEAENPLTLLIKRVQGNAIMPEADPLCE